MFNYTAFIKAIVITFRQFISIIFFNSILFCVSIRFTSLTILAKVIVINLAIFFDNALQAGFFFDDAAVEPIGIISDAVNTGNVALEYAVCVEDAAGCFRCFIGDQRRDSGSRISGLEIEIVGLTVDFGPTGLLQFAVLVVLLAVIIRKPTVGVLPACLECQVGYCKQLWPCPKLIIEFFLFGPFAHLDRAGNQPAIEGVTLASKTTFGKRVILARLAVDDLYRIHRTDAAVGIKGDDRVLGPLGIQGGIRAEIHDRPVGIGLAGTVLRRVPTGKGIILTGKCVVCQLVTNAGVDAHGLHAARTAVRVKGNGDFVALERPFAVGVHIGVARLGCGGFRVRTIGIAKCGGSDGDLNRRYSRTALRALVGVLFGTGDCSLDKFAGTPAGIDIRATASRIDAAFNVQHAVHIDGSIGDGTAPLTGRRICHRANAIL